MSTVNPLQKLARPRRASRAPGRLGDENTAAAGGVSVATTGAEKGARLISKGSTTSLGVGKRGSASNLTVSAGGASGLGAKGLAVTGPAAKAAARRAFDDVSNAKAAAAERDRNSKDLKVNRTRTASSSSTATTTVSTSTSTTTVPLQPPSSTGTGLSRLKIGVSSTSSTVGVSKARRAPLTRASNANLRHAAAPPASSSSSSSITADDIKWQGKWEHNDDDDAVETLREETEDVDNHGLGFKNLEGTHDAVLKSMQAHHDAVMSESEDDDAGAFGGRRHAETQESPSLLPHKRRQEEIYSSDEEAQADEDAVGGKVRIVDDLEVDTDNWMMSIEDDEESRAILEVIKKEFDEQLDFWDTTMVAEYAGEIFEYMSELEESAMPNPRYMDHQTEIEWPMRATLIDWLLQVHMRYHMLPETLWIAINIIDRFLSNRIVSLVKFQLVGVTAMFIAAKYEEIMAPSVDEFVYMTEGGYSRDEILKGERIVLSSLEFNVSPYCSPYTWVRRISKADDYDIQTRTLSKFLMEVTLLDHRFLRAKPSMIAAIGMYLARRMLGGEWNEAFIYYSDYTEAQLSVPTGFLVESIAATDFDQRFVYKKYSSKKFLKASLFARNWSKTNAAALASEASASASGGDA